MKVMFNPVRQAQFAENAQSCTISGKSNNSSDRSIHLGIVVLHSFDCSDSNSDCDDSDSDCKSLLDCDSGSDCEYTFVIKTKETKTSFNTILANDSISRD